MENKKKYPWSEETEELMDNFADGSDDLDDLDDFDEDDVWEPCDESPFEEEIRYDTPKKIKEYLDERVYKQDEAKKAAAMIAYKSFVMGIRENALFIGPSGCGKTHIFQMLKQIFSNIVIVDASNVTMDGWSGGKKVCTLFSSPVFDEEDNVILVLDEADKMLAPKYSRNYENVSHHIQGEFLKVLEGTTIAIKSDHYTRIIDTSKISFVLCGAFNQKAEDMAEKSSGSRLGFCSVCNDVKAYDKPIAEKELLDFGVIPEFLGRIGRIVNLERITADDFYLMLKSSASPIARIANEYGCQSLKLSDKKKHEIAEKAAEQGLGVRYIENCIRQMLDDAIFERPERQKFSF